MSLVDKEWETCTATDLRYGPSLPVFRHPGSGLYIRNRGDAGLIATDRREYAPIKPFTYQPGSLLLDLGGFIGDTVWYFMKHLGKVERAISVEPDPQHVEFLKLNWGDDPRVRIVPAAVIDDGRSCINLYLGRTYTSDNATEPYRGRQRIRVDTVAFEELLEERPALIKADIEGGEFGLDWSKLPDSVTEVIMELHQHRHSWIEEGRHLDRTLLDAGFRHVKAPQHRGFFSKTQIALWSRRV